MTVKDLQRELAKYNPDAEVHYPVEDGIGTTEICETYESTTQYGIALQPVPPPTTIVVLASGWEGL